MTDIVNARDDFSAVGDFTANDTAALQAAIDACFGSVSTPNGTNYIQNKVLFIPNGHYKITAPLLLTKLQGAKIYGSGRFTTTIENVTEGDAVIRTNGMGYSSISDMQLVCHEDGVCLDLDDDGEGGGAALQANTIENIFCLGSYEEGTVGVRIGQSGFMGSECILKMVHNQGCMLAGTLINNYNALQHQFYGGQDQGCGIGIWVTVGSAPVISGRGFQLQETCDIKTSGGGQNAMSIVGCRTESANFILNEGGQSLDVSACVQTSAGEPEYFVRSPGGFVTIRGCRANGLVRPDYWCNLILENSEVGLEIDPAYLWWIPNNDIAANIFVRNCFLTENSVYNHVFEKRAYTEDGVGLMVATYVPGTYGPVVVSSSVGGGGGGTVFDKDLSAGTADAGWQGYTIVQLLAAANLSAASGTQMRITLFFKDLPSGAVVGGYVGQKAAAGDAYDFTGTQAQLRWSASATYTSAGITDGTFISDWITLGEAYDEAKAYLVALQLSGTVGGGHNGRNISSTGDNLYYKSAAADAATTDKSGYTLYLTDKVEFVTKIEIQ